MQYIVAMHETDIVHDQIIRSLRTQPCIIDKSYMKKYGFCECRNMCLPIIRELKIYEIDILDPAWAGFEKVLKDLGIRPLKKMAGLKFLFNFVIHKIFGKHVTPFDYVRDDGTKQRWNSRSTVLFKKSNEEWHKNRQFATCQNCRKKYPSAWL